MPSYDISVIIPVLNERESLPELYSRIMESIRTMREDGMIREHELLFINDGSTDETEEYLIGLHDRDPRVHMISFRKNFGKSTALNVGFRHAKGDLVLTIDSDLQDDPAEFPNLIRKLEEGYDLVVGWKQERKDNAEKRIPSLVFNRVVSRLSGVKLHDHDCGLKAFRKEVADALELYGELHRYIPVLAYRKGFRIAEIPVRHHKRSHGKSKYGVERYLRGGLDCLTTMFLLHYSDRPMYLFGRLGIGSFLAGFVICFYLTVLWFSGQKIGGRPLLVLGVLLLILGIQFISTGFLGNLLVDITHRSSYREDYIRKEV